MLAHTGGDAQPEDEVEKKPEEHELRREEYNAAEDNVHVQVAVQGDVLVVAVVASIVQEAVLLEETLLASCSWLRWCSAAVPASMN